MKQVTLTGCRLLKFAVKVEGVSQRLSFERAIATDSRRTATCGRSRAPREMSIVVRRTGIEKTFVADPLHILVPLPEASAENS